MPIFYPDILEHNNPAKALVDVTQLRGSTYPLGTLNETGSIPVDKRNLGVVVFVSSSQEFYGFYGQTTASADWDEPLNWKTLSTFSGSYVGSFSGSFTGDGSGLINIPASGITGLNLSQIATGSISASVSTGTESFIVSSGSTNLLFISSSGNVGVGVNNPDSYYAKKLVVSSADESGITLASTSTLNANYIAFADGTTGNAAYRGYLVYRHSADSLGFASAGTERLRIDSAGNVGIGIVLPTARLQVKGSGATSSTTVLRVENANASASLVVLDDGNVGIGTSTPLTDLYVSKTNPVFRLFSTQGNRHGTIEQNSNTLGIGSQASTVVIGTLYAPSLSVPSINTIRLVNTQFGIGVSSAELTTSGSKVHIKSTGSGSLSTALLIQNSANIPLLTIKDDGSTIITGNIGIGTTSPTSSLHVVGPGTGSNVVTISPSGSPDIVFRADSVITGYSGIYIGNKYVLRTKNVAPVLFNVQEGVNLADGNSTKSTINSAGSFGLGITSLASIAARLHLRGTGTTSTTTALRVENANASASFIVLDDGNTGIGTITPSFRLDVSGSGRFTDGLTVTGSLQVTNGITGSFSGSGLIESASYALTASYLDNYLPPFPYTGSAEITGSLIVTGSISTSTLAGVESRVVVADTSGSLQPTSQVIIDAYIDPNGTQASQLNTTSNWSVYGEYVGTAISDTFQGQRHYNVDYFFEAVNDNEWIRLIRG